MDTTRARVLAAMLGASGALAGVAVIEVAVLRSVTYRIPNLVSFCAFVLLVGACGGAFGHWMFLNAVAGSLSRRAFVTGASVGLAIALVVWAGVFTARTVLFPLAQPAPTPQLMERGLVHALIAGPLIGVAASFAVVIQLRRLGVVVPETIAE